MLNQNLGTGIVPTASSFTLSKTASVTEVMPGEIFYYTITIQNTGTTPLTIGVITDPLPQGLTVAGEVISEYGNISVSGSNNLTITATGAIAPGSSRTFTIPVMLDPGFTNDQLSQNSADVRFNDGSGSNATTQGPAITVTKPPVIQVTKKASVTTVYPGQAFNYIVNIQNISNQPTGNPINLTDLLPAGVTLNGAVTSNFGAVTNQGTNTNLDLSVAGMLNTYQTGVITIPVIYL